MTRGINNYIYYYQVWKSKLDNELIDIRLFKKFIFVKLIYI